VTYLAQRQLYRTYALCQVPIFLEDEPFFRFELNVMQERRSFRSKTFGVDSQYRILSKSV
jgi:hypothetical protein